MADTKVTNRERKYQTYLTAGTTTAYTVTASWFTYADDFEVVIEPNQNNAAWPVTIDVNGLWAVTIKRNDGTDLQADDLVANVPAKLYYDQSQNLFFLLVNSTATSIVPSVTYPANAIGWTDLYHFIWISTSPPSTRIRDTYMGMYETASAIYAFFVITFTSSWSFFWSTWLNRKCLCLKYSKSTWAITEHHSPWNFICDDNTGQDFEFWETWWTVWITVERTNTPTRCGTSFDTSTDTWNAWGNGDFGVAQPIGFYKYSDFVVSTSNISTPPTAPTNNSNSTTRTFVISWIPSFWTLTPLSNTISYSGDTYGMSMPYLYSEAMASNLQFQCFMTKS